jgi:tRNA (guanine37-N1)-methyltransferase
MFHGPFTESIIKRAQDKQLVEINIHNLRNWAKDTHKTVDDRPYGGGAGMVLKVEVMAEAIASLKTKNSKIILLTPQGKTFNQAKAKELSKAEHVILICGHYEGFDERIREYLVDEELSIGDFVLTGGELPAMMIADAIVRLIPNVLKKEDATVSESFTDNLLEYPQYTRPEEFNGWKVPEILLSGNHKEIAKWQKEMAVRKTHSRRPDLLSK